MVGTVGRIVVVTTITTALGVKIIFGSNRNQLYHTFRHVIAGGLDEGVVATAIEADITANAYAIGPGLNIRTVTVAGKVLTYNAYKLPSGVINVGRITLP
jgi:hypothetical protein